MNINLKYDNYDKKILDVFDIVSSYFINLIYSEYYNNAKQISISGIAKSLTDIYRSKLIALRDITNTPVERTQKQYTKLIIIQLHKYYQTYSVIHTTLTEFEDTILKQFVPTDYYSILSNKDKEQIFNHIINKILTNLINTILEKYLVKIIDYRNDTYNVKLLQDEAVDIMVIIREEFFNSLVKRELDNEKVPIILFNKLRQTLIDTIREKSDLEISQKKLLLYIDKMGETITNYKLQDNENNKKTEKHLTELNQLREDKIHLKNLSEKINDLTKLNNDLTKLNSDLTKVNNDLTKSNSKLLTENKKLSTQLEMSSKNVIINVEDISPTPTKIVSANTKHNSQMSVKPGDLVFEPLKDVDVDETTESDEEDNIDIIRATQKKRLENSLKQKK